MLTVTKHSLYGEIQAEFWKTGLQTNIVGTVCL